MPPALLLFNPAAGKNRATRLHLVHRVTAALHDRGFAVQTEPTHAKGSAAEQARQAVAQGVTTVFACGGDGTVHEVLQGIVGSQACLGIVPSGSANALAQELGLPRDPVRAARSLSPGQVRPFRTMVVRRPGHMDCFSLCMAGCGPDGALMYRMLTVDRGGMGRWRYYEHALRVFLTHRFAPFRVRLLTRDGAAVERDVIGAMALRVGDLQGIFRGIARGASIHDDALHVVLVTGPARLTLPLWFVCAWLSLTRLHPAVTVHKAAALQTLTAAPLQIDGESAGHSTASVTLDGPWQRILLPGP